MNDAFKKICAQIISILRDAQYRIPSQYLQYMESLVDQAAVSHIEKTLAVFPVALYDNLGDPVGVVSAKCISQVIDSPPIWDGRKWCNVVPTVILAGQNGRPPCWTITHEICHLLSIGPYIQDEHHCWNHHFGILEYSYQFTCGQLVQSYSRGHSGINELITDYITWHLMEYIYESVEPTYTGVKQFRKYVESCCSVEQIYMLIGGYFSGNTSMVQKILLNRTYTSYSSLYNALRSHT